MALGTCDDCGAGYQIPSSSDAWPSWWLCRPCADAERMGE